MSLHVRLASHEREIPGGLTVGDTTTCRPFSVLVVIPIVRIDVASLGLCLIHTVEAQAVEVGCDLDSSFLNGGRTNLDDT
jgi:hypothetical protein